MTYILPLTDHVDKWIKTSVDQAQGKRQNKLIKKVSDEYADLKLFTKEVVEELNRLRAENTKGL